MARPLIGTVGPDLLIGTAGADTILGWARTTRFLALVGQTFSMAGREMTFFFRTARSPSVHRLTMALAI